MAHAATRPVAVAAPARSIAPSFRIDVLRDWADLSPPWDTLAPACQEFPFQRGVWLDAWYKAFSQSPDTEPLLIIARDRASDEFALALPLVRRRDRGLWTAEFADLNLTDYNAPLVGAAAPRDRAGASILWRTIRTSLPDVDLVQLKKMPTTIGGRPNPLALLSRAVTCQLNGNVVTTGEDFDAYRYSLERTVRKELERSWRVFSRHAGARFCPVEDTELALKILAVMEEQQSVRMHELGRLYTLGETAAATFYKNLVLAGILNGDVVMTALMCGDEIVASLLGLRHGDRYVMIRISNAGAAWSNCSPGRLVIERTMAYLHVQGTRVFDFSVGNYAYKRRFRVEPIPLVDLAAGLTWRATPAVVRETAIQALRASPALDKRVRRVLGRPQPEEQD